MLLSRGGTTAAGYDDFGRDVDRARKRLRGELQQLFKRINAVESQEISKTPFITPNIHARLSEAYLLSPTYVILRPHYLDTTHVSLSGRKSECYSLSCRYRHDLSLRNRYGNAVPSNPWLFLRKWSHRTKSYSKWHECTSHASKDCGNLLIITNYPLAELPLEGLCQILYIAIPIQLVHLLIPYSSRNRGRHVHDSLASQIDATSGEELYPPPLPDPEPGPGPGLVPRPIPRPTPVTTPEANRSSSTNQVVLEEIRVTVQKLISLELPGSIVHISLHERALVQLACEIAQRRLPGQRVLVVTCTPTLHFQLTQQLHQKEVQYREVIESDPFSISWDLTRGLGAGPLSISMLACACQTMIRRNRKSTTLVDVLVNDGVLRHFTVVLGKRRGRRLRVNSPAEISMTSSEDSLIKWLGLESVLLYFAEEDCWIREYRSASPGMCSSSAPFPVLLHNLLHTKRMFASNHSGRTVGGRTSGGPPEWNQEFSLYSSDAYEVPFSEFTLGQAWTFVAAWVRQSRRLRSEISIDYLIESHQPEQRRKSASYPRREGGVFIGPLTLASRFTDLPSANSCEYDFCVVLGCDTVPLDEGLISLVTRFRACTRNVVFACTYPCPANSLGRLLLSSSAHYKVITHGSSHDSHWFNPLARACLTNWPQQAQSLPSSIAASPTSHTSQARPPEILAYLAEVTKHFEPQRFLPLKPFQAALFLTPPGQTITFREVYRFCVSLKSALLLVLPPNVLLNFPDYHLSRDENASTMDAVDMNRVYEASTNSGGDGSVKNEGHLFGNSYCSIVPYQQIVRNHPIMGQFPYVFFLCGYRAPEECTSDEVGRAPQSIDLHPRVIFSDSAIDNAALSSGQPMGPGSTREGIGWDIATLSEAVTRAARLWGGIPRTETSRGLTLGFIPEIGGALRSKPSESVGPTVFNLLRSTSNVKLITCKWSSNDFETMRAQLTPYEHTLY